MALDTIQGPGARAPEPASPSRQFSFTGWQVNNPTAPPPGDRLDGEFDRVNASVTQALAWTATVLNTDGTLRPGTVGRAQLQPGLFDRIARDIIGECVAPVDQAQRAASSAFVSAAQSAVNMGVAIAQANGASDSAGTANAAALVATQARDEALDFTGTAADAAVQSSNDANDAAKASNVAQDYAVLSGAWAEHMPDTIPPNILAANDITGDHWSSRWWANRAAALVQSIPKGQGAWFNVRDFGAVGDGVTDDADAFNATFAAVPVAGGTVSVPYGDYVLRSPLVWTGKSVALVGDEGATLWLGHDGIGVSIAPGDQARHSSVRNLEIRALATALPAWAIKVAYPVIASSADQSTQISGVRMLSVNANTPPPYRGSLLGGIWLVNCWASVVSDSNYFGPAIGGTGSNPPGSIGLRHEGCYNLVLDGFRTVAADKCVQANDYSEKVVLTRCSLIGNWGYYTESYGAVVNGFAGLEFHSLWTEYDNFYGNVFLRAFARGRIVGNNCVLRDGANHSHIELKDCLGLMVALNAIQDAPGGTNIGVHCTGTSYSNVITNNYLSGQVYIAVQFDANTSLNHAHGNLGLDAPNLYSQRYVDLGPRINDTDNTLDWLSGPARFSAGPTGRTFCNSGGLGQIHIPDVQTPVNSLWLFAGNAGEAIRFITTGSDTNIGMLFITKGQGGAVFSSDAGTGLIVAPQTATTVNYPVLRSDAAGQGPRYAVEGSDTDIDLRLQPKGNGQVKTSAPLVLPADPTTPLQAATKQYVDAHAGAGGLADAPSNGTTYGRLNAAWTSVLALTSLASTPPAMDGTAAAGTAVTVSRSDHVHATDTSRYAATNPSGYQTAAQVTAAVPVASSTTPAMDGTAAAGTGTTWARADHVHATDTSRLAVTGGTITQTATTFAQNFLTIRNNMQGAGQAGIDFNVAGGAEVSVSKAGIGLLRSIGQGGGSVIFYSRITADTNAYTAADERMRINSSGNVQVAGGLGLFGTVPSGTKPVVTGSRGGNVALASLLTALAGCGFITDSSSA